jgi:uncharacterized protein YjbI with pentapeptide repeats
LKNNTGTVNLVIIFLLAVIQVRTLGILQIIGHLSPRTAYRIVRNYPLLTVPRLVVTGKPIVEHYRALELPLPYTDAIQTLKRSVEGLKAQEGPSRQSRSKINQLILSGRDLRFAILDGSDLKGVVLKNALLQGASLTNAILDGAIMTSANLKGANLKKTSLKGAVLVEAHIDEVILEEALLEHANLESAFLNGADLTNAKLNHAFLSGASFVGSILQSAKLTDSFAEMAIFRAADLSRVDFRHAYLKDTDFYAADLSQTILQNAIFSNSTLVAANLEGSNMRDANFRDADMFAANLKDFSIEDVDWTGASLVSSQITGIDNLVKLVNQYGAEKVYGLNVFENLSKACEFYKNPSAFSDNLKVYFENQKLRGQWDADVSELKAQWEKDADHPCENIRRKGLDGLQESCRSPDPAKSRCIKDFEERIEKILESIGLKGIEVIVVDNLGLACFPPSESDVDNLVYRLRSEVVCDSAYAAKGIMRQLLFEKNLEHQRHTLLKKLERNCTEIATQMREY